MDILLLYPKIPGNDPYSLRPPLGLAYLASVLKEVSHKVQIKDLNIDSIDYKKLDNFDIIGISMLTPSYCSAKNLIADIRKHYKGTIIVGGPHPSALPELTLKENKIDYILRGESEETIVDLLDTLKKKGDIAKVKGISYRKDDKILHNADRLPVMELDKIPLPSRDLLQMDKYVEFIENGRKMTSLMSSRGCPYNCNFCFKIDGNKWRARSAENILKEIKGIIKDYNISGFFFNDDLFTFNRDRVMKFCDLVLKEKLDIKWKCMARVNRVDEELLRHMKKAGCVGVNYGIESGNQEILNKIRKGITLEQAKKAMKITKKVGLSSTCYFMIGFPDEKKHHIEDTIEFASRLDCDQAHFFTIIPYPGTELWHYAIKTGIFSLDNMDWSMFYANTMEFKETVYFTETLSKQEIVNLRKKAYKKFLLRTLKRRMIQLDFKYFYKKLKEKRADRILKLVKNVFGK